MDTATLQQLVDWEEGLISPRVFVDEEIYEQELDRLFGRVWLFLAHDTMIPNSGDFFSTYMGVDPVIVVRQRDGSVKAFLNACRHRGMKVCRTDEGNAKAFTCPYHGWTYDPAGRLVSVPNLEEGYHGRLDTSTLGLIEVAQIDSYKGFYFGNFDPTAPPLVDFLGDMTWYMDAWIDRVDGGIEFLPGVIKWTVAGNWKLAAEQFAGDAYHVGMTHPSVPLLAPELMEFLKADGRQFISRLGHGEGFPLDMFEWGGKVRFGSDVLEAHYREMVPELEQRLGAARARGPVASHFNIFPNLAGLAGSGEVRVWHPKGPNSFEIWLWIQVDSKMPEEAREVLRSGACRFDGASGMIEQDDSEIWGEIGRNLTAGRRVREAPFNYQMGLGDEYPVDPDYPGRINPTMLGEAAQRSFYRRWLEFMTSESWPHVPEDDVRPGAVQSQKAGR